jgi:hypothetical protein
MVSEKPTSQRKLRETARTKLAQIEEVRSAGQYIDDQTLREALKAVVAASVKATLRVTSEFAGRLAREAIVIGDLDADPETVRLWRPFTSGSEHSIRRDGQLIDVGGEYQVLDIVSHRDTCCVDDEQVAAAGDAWFDGGVLLIDAEEPINCPALLLPRRNIPAEWVGEALGRHFQTTVSQPELVV